MSSKNLSNINYDGLRKKLNAFLDELLIKFYKEVPFSEHLLKSRDINLEYYKRHNIEIILRLRLKRTIDALTIHYFTKRDPKLAKIWCQYTDDEMLHDKMFAKDLEAVGVLKDEIYNTDPMFSTKLLQGYFYYGLEHENRPLASLCSSYFIEYMSVETQSKWLDNVEKTLGEEKVKGARAHVNHDLEDHHIDFVWNVLKTFINTDDDAQKVFDHVLNIYKLFAMFYTELYGRIVEKKKDINLSFNELV